MDMKVLVVVLAAALSGGVTCWADCTGSCGCERQPKISVFAGFVRKIAKERGVSLAEAADRLYALGVRGYDCGPDEADLDELAATRLRPVNFYYFPKWPVGGPSYADQTTPEECLAKAKRYGIPRIMVVPPDFSKEAGSDAEFAAMVGKLRDFVVAAKARGIEVTGVDFGGTMNPCSHMKYLKRFLDEIPDLGFALDSGNLNYAGRGEDVLEMLDAAKGRIRHVHLKDQSKADSRAYVTLGLGGVPNEQVIKRTWAGGYDGWYTLENPVGDTLADTARQVAVLKLWLSEVRVGKGKCR